MAADSIYRNQKLMDILSKLLKYSAYIFVFYTLTDIRLCSDLKRIIPDLTVLSLFLYVMVKKEFGVFKTHLFYALFGYVLISYLLLPFSFAPMISIKAINRDILAGFLLFLAVHFQTNSALKAKSFLLLSIAIIIFVAAGGYITFFYQYSKSGVFSHMYPDFRLIKFQLYYNKFAMIINFLLPFAISYITYYKGGNKRFLIYPAIILSALAVILSISRGGWLSLTITVALWILFFKSTRKKFLMLTALGLIIVLPILWFASPTFQKRILDTRHQIKTLNNRVEIWENSLAAIKDSPAVGWGYGDQILWDGKPFILDKSNRDVIPEKIRLGSHNILLHVAFHQGMIGLAGFIYFLLTGFILLLKEMNRAQYKDSMLYAIFCVFISVFVVHSLIEITPFQFICIALGFLSGLRENSQG